MILVSFSQSDFTIMGMNRIDAGAVPMLASPANPMNRTIQGVHSWDHQDCGVCTKGRVLGVDSAYAMLSLTSFNWRETGGKHGVLGNKPHFYHIRIDRTPADT